MLEIDDLTYRFGPRLLFDGASAQISAGWKVGLVGRNGAGKSTLVKLILSEANQPGGAVRLRKGARLGAVAQEVPATDDPLIELVLATDVVRHRLMQMLETATDAHVIADAHHELEMIDAHGAEARAAAAMAGLGFKPEDLRRPAKEFSGGWRMRAALAGVLAAQPDLLILDEPTNYLDLEGAAWLEAYLRKYPYTALIVSHDRDLLNRAVTHTLALQDAKLEIYPGGYDTYLKRRAERTANLAAQKQKQDAAREHLQAFVDRFRAKASKARQAQSRIKALERMQDIAVPVSERTVPFVLEDPGELASPIIELENAAIGYGARAVLSDVSIRLDADDRIAIVGVNGQGKSTLVKAIAGRLGLMDGERRAAKALRIGYFSQDQLDELHAGESVLAHVARASPTATQAKQRAIAAQIGFGPEKVQTNVEKLSGGEKVRLLLGLLASEKPHLLILDEPTSHLDIDSREALIMALNGYAGAVLLITHDVYLAEACADRVWLVSGGRASPFEGDLEAYRALVLAADRPDDGRAQAKVKAAAPAPKPQKQSRFTLERRVKDAEAAMAKAETALAAAEKALIDPQVYVYPGKAKAAQNARDAAEKALKDAEEDWLAASEALASL